jgi:hypothetical protein
MAESFYKLDPPARFGTVAPEGEMNQPVRLFVADEGVAAVLDGLRIETNKDLTHLLGVAISAITGPLHADSDLSDTGFDRAEFPIEIAVLGSRLPLAAEVLRDLRANGAGSEGHWAEIEALITGIPTEFKVTKSEKRQLHKTVRILRDAVDGEKNRQELDALLSDLERGRTLRTLPIPTLLNWCNPIIEEIRGQGWSKVDGADSGQDEKRVRGEHETARQMWIRLRTEIRQHGRG